MYLALGNGAIVGVVVVVVVVVCASKMHVIRGLWMKAKVDQTECELRVIGDDRKQPDSPEENQAVASDEAA